MRQLFIRDWKAARLYILILLILIPISYAISFPTHGNFIWALLSFLFIVFFIEKQNNVDQFLVSLPFSRIEIVRARYLFLVSISILSVGLLWLVDVVGYKALLPFIEISRLSLLEVIQQFSLTLFLFSFYIPVFYLFKQFIHTATFFMISFVCIIYFNALMVGNPLITFDDPIRVFMVELFSIQPYLMPIVLSFICLMISYKISVQIFNRKDIV
jgi:ABC-2 type transport system permease protein